MVKHPYQLQPDVAFWSRSITSTFDPSTLTSTDEIFKEDDQVVSAGSCFASNLVPWLAKSGIKYLRSQENHPAFSDRPDNLGYDDFSAKYGNIYSARHLLQLLQRALGMFVPQDDRWHLGGVVIDPFRPGLRYPARDDIEFDLLTSQHLQATKEVFSKATVFFFTLGLTEAWISTIDGAVYPACPGTVAGVYDEHRHQFKNFTVSEIKDDLVSFIGLVRSFNPTVRFVLTVSPVPLVATATDQHVLLATTYSKSVLRVAAAQVCDELDDVSYFPAYEIITGPQAPSDFYAENKREVTAVGIEAVMSALFSHRLGPTDDDSRRSLRLSEPNDTSNAAILSSRISQAECDEILMDRDQ